MTIIVLLILAGVTIATLTGENGLLSKAQIAKERNKEAEEDEKDKLLLIDEVMSNYSNTNRGNLNITDENELNRIIDARIAEKVFTPKVFNGMVVTNTMPGSNSSAKVNSITITESGKYIINYVGQLKWETDSVFGLVIYKNNTDVLSGNMYSNKLSYSSALLNATEIQQLNENETIDIVIYQYNNGDANVNNLTKNDLQLVKISN